MNIKQITIKKICKNIWRICQICLFKIKELYSLCRNVQHMNPGLTLCISLQQQHPDLVWLTCFVVGTAELISLQGKAKTLSHTHPLGYWTGLSPLYPIGQSMSALAVIGPHKRQSYGFLPARVAFTSDSVSSGRGCTSNTHRVHLTTHWAGPQT